MKKCLLQLEIVMTGDLPAKPLVLRFLNASNTSS